MRIHNAGAVILAAGESSRMNSLKALLAFNNEFSFLEKILDTYSKWGCNEIVVVVGQSLAERLNELKAIPPAISIVVNVHPDYERFYSVKLGLGSLKNTEYCFLQNVDNPFIEGEILDVLYENRRTESFVVPVFDNKGGHPVLLNRKNINFISNYKSDTANLKEVLKLMRSKRINMNDDRILININDPEEYSKFFNKARNGINLS